VVGGNLYSVPQVRIIAIQQQVQQSNLFYRSFVVFCVFDCTQRAGRHHVCNHSIALGRRQNWVVCGTRDAAYVKTELSIV